MNAHALLGFGQLGDFLPGGVQCLVGREVEASDAFAPFDNAGEGGFDAAGDAMGEVRGSRGAQHDEQGQRRGHVTQAGGDEVGLAGEAADPPLLLAQLQGNELGEPGFVLVFILQRVFAMPAGIEPACVPVGQEVYIEGGGWLQNGVAAVGEVGEAGVARHAHHFAGVGQHRAAAPFTNRGIDGKARQVGEKYIEGQDARLAVGAGPPGGHGNAAIAGGEQAIGGCPCEGIVAGGFQSCLEPRAAARIVVSVLPVVIEQCAGGAPVQPAVALVLRARLGDPVAPAVRVPHQHDFPAVGVGQMDRGNLRITGEERHQQGVEAGCVVEFEALGLAPGAGCPQLGLHAPEGALGLRLDVPGGQVELDAGEDLGGRCDDQKVKGGAEEQQTGDEGGGHAPQQTAGEAWRSPAACCGVGHRMGFRQGRAGRGVGGLLPAGRPGGGRRCGIFR